MIGAGDIIAGFDYLLASPDPYRAGQTIGIAPTGPIHPAVHRIGYQWFCGGSPISGATSASYVLRQADVGCIVHAVVTVEADGFTGLPVVLRGLGPVTAASGKPGDLGNAGGRSLDGVAIVAAGLIAAGVGIASVRLRDRARKG